MSVRVMTAVWSIKLPDSEKLVLLALADCANDEGHCWPSMATLSAKCSKSDRTVQASIKALVEAGHLTRKENPGKGCNYIVHPRSACTPEATSPPKPLPPTPEEPAGPPPKPLRTNRKENHQEPSGETRKRAPSPIEIEVPDWVPAEPWSAFVAMRSKKKKPVSTYIAKQLFGRLRTIRDAGWNLEDVINKATVNFNDGFWLPDGRDPSMRRATAKPANSNTPASSPEQQAADLERTAAFYRKIDRDLDADELERKAAALRRSKRPQGIGDLVSGMVRGATA